MKKKALLDDKTGRRYGILTVLGLSERTGTDRYWLCRCDCGKYCEARGGNLATGSHKSCGCRKYTRPPKHGGSVGGSWTPEYTAYHGIKQRCLNPNSPAYVYYGGRGITVCPRWIDSFNHFLEDMGPRPKGFTSIDRINNNGNYEPGNCRWSNDSEQQRNKRNNRLITINGITKCQAEWCALTGIHQATVNDRIRRGWPDEKLFIPPVTDHSMYNKYV